MQMCEELLHHTEAEEVTFTSRNVVVVTVVGVDSLGTCKRPQGREPRQLSWVQWKGCPTHVVPNHGRGKGIDMPCPSLNVNVNTETPVIDLDDPTGWPNG